jgi:hypothetical protein
MTFLVHHTLSKALTGADQYQTDVCISTPFIKHEIILSSFKVSPHILQLSDQQKITIYISNTVKLRFSK